MISSENKPKLVTTFDEDFTEAHYRQLLRAAKVSYHFANYNAIPWGKRFILWRHDIDFSINRSVALACIEAEEGVIATYFVNPRSEYYNPFEPGQARLLKQILNRGHRLGLHFDAAFHADEDEVALNRNVAQEARWLEEAFGVCPDAFSFHNPGANHLRCDADHYGGLLNCYSQRFKADVPYCSDSNGYWRFRRLHDVLTAATDHCLQVLTHPGWWQSKSMPPRQRTFRSVYGRAQATMNGYDAALVEHGRINHTGLTGSLRFLQPLHPRVFDLCDYLWNQGHLSTLFLELWRLHERQINMFCTAVFRKEWQVPAAEINAFFENRLLTKDGRRLFNAVFARTWQQAAGLEEGQYKDWVALRKSLSHGRSTTPDGQLEEGSLFLCRTIERLVAWGRSQPMGYDGISRLDSIGVPTNNNDSGSLTDRLEEIANEVSDFSVKRWAQFKADMQKLSADEAAE